ncbi:MAG: isoprenylcysteine carboxylmethyltransferase family protein [Proteobacteria bacterium]|nr:isoprenylcysteine carboxylmethyltransferase family protein [Pseudomonadota bacterium]
MSLSAIVAENVFWVCVVVWFLMRVPRQRRARLEAVATSRRGVADFIVRQVAALGFGVLPFVYVITKIPHFATYPFWPPLAWIGSAVFLVSLWVFYLTHRELGHSFSPSLEIRRAHRLATGGVYRQVRHPMYVAFLLWAVAQALLLPNWVAGPAGLAGWLVLFAFRVGREERMMLDAFGDEYRAYMARTARLVPGLY